MAVSDETMRSFERAADEFCRAFATPAPTLSKTSEAPVVAVHDDGTLDVGYGGAVLTVRMTTACAGVAVGDTVLLTAYGQMLYATGVLARDNGHYVKTLWSNNGFYMNENQTATLSEPVSEQRTGIVMHWQAYLNGITQNYQHNYVFVPKSHVEESPAEGVQCVMRGNSLVVKYVYVADTYIRGNANNSNTALVLANIGTCNNRELVMTEVLGV